jgi:hypothetical protein
MNNRVSPHSPVTFIERPIVMAKPHVRRWSGLCIAGFVVSLAGFPVPIEVDDPKVRLAATCLSFVMILLAAGLAAGGLFQISSDRTRRGRGLGIAALAISGFSMVIMLAYMAQNL